MLGPPPIIQSLYSCYADDESARAERKADEERERDQREKEEFEARLKARDDEKTRKLVESRIPKEDLEDAARRKYETEEEKEGLLPKLRDFSRQEYLKKREDAKLQEMEDAIRDEEMMFGCSPRPTRSICCSCHQHASRYCSSVLSFRYAQTQAPTFQWQQCTD